MSVKTPMQILDAMRVFYESFMVVPPIGHAAPVDPLHFLQWLVLYLEDHQIKLTKTQVREIGKMLSTVDSHLKEPLVAALGEVQP